MGAPELATADMAPGPARRWPKDEGLVQGLAAHGGAVVAVAGCLGFGLLLAFMSCVFPMFPIIAGILARQGESLTARCGLMLCAGDGAWLILLGGKPGFQR